MIHTLYFLLDCCFNGIVKSRGGGGIALLTTSRNIKKQKNSLIRTRFLGQEKALVSYEGISRLEPYESNTFTRSDKTDFHILFMMSL